MFEIAHEFWPVGIDESLTRQPMVADGCGTALTPNPDPCDADRIQELQVGFELLVCPTELGGTVWIAPADPHCRRVEWPAVGVYCGERRVQHVEHAAFVAAVCAAGSFFEASEEDGGKAALLHSHGITSCSKDAFGLAKQTAQQIEKASPFYGVVLVGANPVVLVRVVFDAGRWAGAARAILGPGRIQVADYVGPHV